MELIFRVSNRKAKKIFVAIPKLAYLGMNITSISLILIFYRKVLMRQIVDDSLSLTLK